MVGVDVNLPFVLRAAQQAVQLSAIKELLDRGYGKAPQLVDGDSLGGPINITVRWE